MSWLPATLPAQVQAPEGLTFVPLTPALVDEDYAAVMRDIPMLRAWSGQDWPTTDFPITENLADLVRHDREQRERVALTYSVLIEGVVQGCIYCRPLLDALRSRTLEVPASARSASGDVVVCGWLHDRPAAALIGATMGWLQRPPFTFPRLWWQTSSQCPDQLAACDQLGLTAAVRLPAGDRTWELRSAPTGTDVTR
jgi:hypothetical protein